VKMLHGFGRCDHKLETYAEKKLVMCNNVLNNLCNCVLKVGPLDMFQKLLHL